MLMDQKQFSIRSVLLLIGFAAIALAACIAYANLQIDEMPPQRILKKMESRFDELTLNTSRDQILGELGLGRYKNYLIR